MSDEQKVPAVPATTGKPPQSFEDRLPRMSWRNLQGEVKKRAKELSRTHHLEDVALADILLLVFFSKQDPKQPNRRPAHTYGNDPYCTEGGKSQTDFMEIKSSGGKAKNANK
jgi:hypothetical protein